VTNYWKMEEELCRFC